MGRYKLFIKPSAVKEIESLPRSDRSRVIQRIQRLSLEPRPTGGEKLSGEEKYRVRQGHFRILYAIDDAERTVLVVKVGHRRDVCR